MNIREDNGNGADSVSLSGEDSAVINCENSTITGENSVVNETPTEIPPASPLLQYTSNTSTGFVDICNCLIYEKLRCDETCASSLVINEATTGYLDVATGQSTGSFVTYVIEFGVIYCILKFFYLMLCLCRSGRVESGIVISNC